MKHIYILPLLILLFSCGESTKMDVNTIVQKNWVVSDSNVSGNIYTTSGLLDTSYETTYIFANGMIKDSFKTVITRVYNSDNCLTCERSFDLNEKNHLNLYTETINKYDRFNNLVSAITYVRGEIYHSSRNEYNKAGQLMKSIAVNPHYSTGENSERKPGSYDTSFLAFKYDTSGNCVTTITADRNGAALQISTTIYEGRVKTSSYTVNFAGDTLSKAKFIQENGFVIKSSATDTVWTFNNKLYKSISYNAERKTGFKTIYRYNSKGDKIERMSYKL